MIGRAAILIGVPLAVLTAIALPVGLWKGEYQWLCAAVAAGLVIPSGVLTLLLSERLAGGSPLGPLIALAVGTAVRLFVGFGGAVAIFAFSKPKFHSDPLSYFGWVLGAYLTTLVVETALLAGKKPAGTGAPPKS